MKKVSKDKQRMNNHFSKSFLNVLKILKHSVFLFTIVKIGYPLKFPLSSKAKVTNKLDKEELVACYLTFHTSDK